jgi:hypothetical protein
MKRFTLTAIVLIGLVTAAAGIEGNPVTEATITVSTSTVGISTCTRGQRALVQVKDDQIYYRFETGTATADSGDYLGSVGDIIEIEYPAKFRAIRVTTDAALKVTCFD